MTKKKMLEALPLAASTVPKPPTESIGFGKPEEFLAWASADWNSIPTLDLDALQHIDVWALVALGSLELSERGVRRPPLSGREGGVARFAHALGLNDLSSDQTTTYDAQPERGTVRLTRVRASTEIEPTADRVASLVIRNPQSENIRLIIRYVLVELLRNVIQHSGDALGAVVAAQEMTQAQGRSRAMIQVAVADAGIGIPRHLHQSHPHLTDYRQALERALLPHISGTFREGLTGSFENAGLGLYMITEMARKTSGNLLIATTGAALKVTSENSTPRFVQPSGIGFPGTLVAFEIPTDTNHDYQALMTDILQKSRAQTPKRAADQWLAFTPNPAAQNLSVLKIKESTPQALEFAQREIEPAILKKSPIQLDFAGLEFCTQSWLHALLYESVRLAWARRVPIHIINADPAVREGLRFLEAYALGG